MIARGEMLGANQPVILHLLDIEQASEALNGVKMELIDAAFPLLKGQSFSKKESYIKVVQIFKTFALCFVDRSCCYDKCY